MKIPLPGSGQGDFLIQTIFGSLEETRPVRPAKLILRQITPRRQSVHRCLPFGAPRFGHTNLQYLLETQAISPL